MVKQVQHVRHDTAGANAYTGLVGEFTFEYTNFEIRGHDGTTPGGYRFLNSAQNDARYQAKDADLTAIAALTTTAFGRGFLTETDAASTRTTLGLVIGTNVQAYNATLTSWAGKAVPAGVVVGDTDAQTLSSKTLSSPTLAGTVAGSVTFSGNNAHTGTLNLGGAAGSESVRISPVASAVNYLQLAGNSTGNYAYIQAAGSDANTGVNVLGKGTGFLNVYNNAALQFQVGALSGAVNYLQATGAATGSPPTLAVNGSDSNTSFNFLTKGTGGFVFYTRAGGAGQFVVADAGGTTANNLTVMGGTAGNGPQIIAAGSDSNVALNLISKGSSGVGFATGGSATNYQLVVSHVASAVAYADIKGGTGTTGFVLSAQGSGSDLNTIFQAKGTGGHYLQTGSNLNQLSVSHTSAAVNRIDITGAATGGAPIMSAVGSDSNIDLAFVPKGTGVLKFGTYTASALSVTGYITIKDSAGTTRRLLVG